MTAFHSLLRAITRRRSAIVIQMPRGPKNAARYEIKVTGVFDGFVVMTDGCAEDAGFLGTVFISPGDDIIVGFLTAVALFDGLFTVRDWPGGFENVDVVVVLFMDRRPIIQTPGDRAFLVGKRDGDWLLRTVAAGLQAEVFEPKAVRRAGCDGAVWVADAIAVHRAVQVDARDAVAVRFEHAFDKRGIGDVRGAFVMNHEVVAIGVIRMAQDGQRRMCAGIIGVDLIDDYICARFDALLEDVLLLRVVMAATAGNEQHTQRLGRRGGAQGNAEYEERQEK